MVTLLLTMESKLINLSISLSELDTKGAGNLSLFDRPCVAIVGSRKPTPYGIEVTEHVVSELVRAGVVIISGLAFGVDATAHRAALKYGGQTVAVLPSGIDTIYPASHRALADQIMKTGLLVTQFKPGHRPRKHDFLHRNRLIAGLSDAVVIPEAAERSGSLNTARHALDLGIPVFAAPGRLTDHMSRGTNKLIYDMHAKMMNSSDDLLQAVGIQPHSILTTSPYPEDSQEFAVLSAISSAQQNTSSLVHELQVPITELQPVLTQLEIAGLITLNSANNWSLATNLKS